MLKKSQITAIKIHTEDWHKHRLAKFTSSEAHHLIGSGFKSYVRRKVGELMTGRPARKEIDTEDTRHGILYEPEAIKKHMAKIGLPGVCTQLFIEGLDEYSGSTPDFIVANRFSPDETEIEVETGEVKCPPTFDGYLLLFECETPQQLKEAKKEYYWQVIDQIGTCGAQKGHFVAYHPDFRAGNMRHIVFDKMQSIVTSKGKTFPIYEDIKLLKATKEKAIIAFDELRDRLIKTPLL